MSVVRTFGLVGLALIGLVLSNVNGVPRAHAALPAEVDGQALPSLAPLVERVHDSMVRMAVQSRVQVRRDPFDDPFFRRFFDSRRSATRNRQHFTSGVVIDALDGLILTNENAVRGATNIKVHLHDGREVEGTVIGADPATNVAVVKVNAVGLTAIALGNSDALRIGDFVVSIGDPLGEENTLLTGVVSALAQKNSLQAHQNFIRSDAAVGAGVLVDLNGALVGLNTSKAATTAGSSRIGFSTPINMALRVKDQIVQYGTPQRGFLAVQIQDLTPSLAQAFAIEDEGGAVVTNVIPESTASEAGLQVGDVVLSVGSQAINRGNDLRHVIGQHFAGDILDISVARQGEVMNLRPVLESSTRPSAKGQMIHYQLEGATFNGSDTRQISASSEEGVRVGEVEEGSVAWRHGVRENDLIVSANRRPVNDLDSLREAIAGKDVLMLNIVRGTGALFLLLQ